MAIVWRNALVLVFVHFVVSQTRFRCGEPPKYPDKQLDIKYIYRPVFNHQEKVSYRCDRGHVPSDGSRISFCKRGRWTPLTLKCQKVKCNGLADIENGQYRQEGQSYGDKAMVICNQGYVLRGVKFRICLENGWSGTDPVCLAPKVTCSAPRVENRGIKPGERTHYTPQDTVRITCSEGFDLIGSSVVTCGPDGQWRDLPECHRKVPKIICSAPAVENRWIKPGESTQFTPQDTVSITCNEGFDLIGSSVVTCGPDGQWQDLPKCHRKVILCSAPAVANGRINAFGNQYKPKDTVSITCSEGFELIGSPQVTCGPDGQWQGLPECRPKKRLANVILCSSPAVANGRINAFGNQHKPKDTVSITCSEGFELIGSPQVTCGPDGQWKGLPECRPKRHLANIILCSSPAVANGRINAFGNQHKPRDTVSITCSEGFELIGSPQVTCGPDGQWQGLPECRPLRRSVNVILCSAPAVANGRINESSNQHKPKDTVSITCSEGFELIGSPQVTCGPDGQWQGLPECHPKKLLVNVTLCSAPAVANGRINEFGNTFKPKDTVSITCSEGFELIGSPQVTCGPDSQWQGLPECHPIRRVANGKCGPPPSYVHRNVFFRDGTPALAEYSSGARIRYKCNLGLRRASGSDIIRCQGGEWTKLALRCQRKSCGSAGEISFGRFQYTGVSFGDSARAICQEGYELIGPEERVCRDGGWDGRTPVCEPVYCPPPPEVRDAEVSDFRNEDVPVGHMVSYHCQTGALIGTRDLYCTPNGTWSGPAPLCKDISCPHPNVPRGYRMRGFRSVYKYGNSVTIACSPGLRLYGESFVTCGADGNWTPKLPECRR
ncbi:sushi, von Willebrand factor type A, EGF and pentraxin domain-containing protein 1 [Danio aesculapii]|uniref:sushi, von Willebrand factor type A, EGF and pentraxin domain-containing protein 1 n=1 Tax=Danio aesculapii TaxID=1142201 RepID=UPI0024C018E3|nr:sushi, von Willebrand factor type A, EGF and pentraxin domain-containing protein 1 [Danio aesculapii]